MLLSFCLFFFHHFSFSKIEILPPWKFLENAPILTKKRTQTESGRNSGLWKSVQLLTVKLDY